MVIIGVIFWKHIQIFFYQTLKNIPIYVHLYIILFRVITNEWWLCHFCPGVFGKYYYHNTNTLSLLGDDVLAKFIFGTSKFTEVNNLMHPEKITMTLGKEWTCYCQKSGKIFNRSFKITPHPNFCVQSLIYQLSIGLSVMGLIWFGVLSELLRLIW